jgi:glycerol-1-phosphate dehydrogenase [NAD(P)+]
MMTTGSALTGLASVRALLAEADPKGALVPCGLQELIVGSDVLGRVADAVTSVSPAFAGDSRRVVVLVDETPILRRSPDGLTQDVKDEVVRVLSAESDVHRAVLSDGHPELHVTASVVDDACAACQGADVIVAVGGGTISDISKLAAAALPGIPVVTVMTAASVDGYSDNVSVTLRDGVKRTVPSVWPDVVLADAETVAGAPSRMNRAGYGEMTSMYVAPADWRLAALVEVDMSFHPGPVVLLDALGAGLDESAPGIGDGDPEAVQRLTWALTLRGIATGVAGSTACLSGVEHLVSHMLDLRAAQLHLPTGLHGEQVGAGSVIAACAWEMLHERLAAAPASRVVPATLDPDAAEELVHAAFDPLDRTGRISHECWRDYSRKLTRITERLPRVNEVLAGWSGHAGELQAMVRPSHVIARGLASAGTPVVLEDLGPDVDASTARWAVQNCGLMRDRFTVVDLLTVLDWWQPADVDEVEARVNDAVARAGAGA